MDDMRTPEGSGRTVPQSILRKGRSAAFASTPVTSKAVDDSTSNSEHSTLDFGNESFDEAIQRFTNLGDSASALYWIDASYAKLTEHDMNPDYVKLAKYLKLLSTVSQWMRVSDMIEGRHLIGRHLIFAYYYVNSLFHRHLYNDIVTAPIGHLFEDKDLPIRYQQLEGIEAIFADSRQPPISEEQLVTLNSMVDSMKVMSAIMLVFGKTYMILENREAASQCLTMALFQDPNCIVAQQHLEKYNLVAEKDSSKFNSIVAHRKNQSSEADPRVKTNHAIEAFQRGEAIIAHRITESIMKQHGMYPDAVLVHINSLVQLNKSNDLFTMAHKLVEAMPDNEISWYAVALYYYVCKNTQAAKNFMHKATNMNPGFGEGWLAFGHILAADAENEQALNCYYRASRILERHCEPLLYVAIQYCKSGVSLAEQFLRDAANISPNNPIVIHEQACLAYSKKDFPKAQKMFESAYRLIAGMSPDEKIVPSALSRVPIDEFWASLINNLGHCARRLGKYQDAIAYHTKAILMNPTDVVALNSLAMSYASMGNISQATTMFHKGLAIRPYDNSLTASMEKMLTTNLQYTSCVDPIFECEPSPGGMISPEELEKLLISCRPEQDRAANMARELRRNMTRGRVVTPVGPPRRGPRQLGGMLPMFAGLAELAGLPPHLADQALAAAEAAGLGNPLPDQIEEFQLGAAAVIPIYEAIVEGYIDAGPLPQEFLEQIIEEQDEVPPLAAAVLEPVNVNPPAEQEDMEHEDGDVDL